MEGDDIFDGDEILGKTPLGSRLARHPGGAWPGSARGLDYALTLAE